MKILCVCRYGSVRSTAMAHVLKNQGNEAIAAGYDTLSPETMRMLMDWADFILIAEDFMIDNLPPVHNKPIVDVGIGPDVWGMDGIGQLVQEVKPLIEHALIKYHTGNIWNK